MSRNPQSHGRGLALKCKWIKRLYSAEGDLKFEKENYNIITSAGVSALVQFLSSANAAATTNTFNYIAVGTDSTTEQTSNTALGTELSRHTGTVSYNAGGVLEVVATFAAGSGTGAIVEYGILNSNTGGDLLNRDTEAVINKGASDSLVVTAQITFQPG